MQQKKDFKKWHEKKAAIHTEGQRVFFHEREVWWCSLGANIGFEQDGKGEKFARPVLVFKKFNKEVFRAIPLTLQTKKKKENEHFYAPVEYERRSSTCRYSFAVAVS